MMNLGFIFFFLTLVCSSGTWAQIDNPESSTEGRFPPPTGLIALPNGTARATSYQIIGWMISPGAISYLLKIYRRSDNVVVIEMRFDYPFVNVTGLQDGTNYTAKVQAIYELPLGGIIKSTESLGVDFRTDKECTGGSRYTDSSGHCVASCVDPDPVCSRIGTPGCSCPRNLPVWHEGVCISPVLCPPRTAQPARPNNVRSIPSIGSRNVIVTWNRVDNASEYIVKVRTARQSTAEQRSFTSRDPIIAIPDLTPGIQYVVSVSASLQSNSESSNAISPPSNIITTDVTNNGFRVRWRTQEDARRYIFFLYDETRRLIYINEKIAAPVIDVVGLSPGTTYYYALASARLQGKPGMFSPLQQVTTRGSQNNLENSQATVVVEIPLTNFRPIPTTTTTTTTTTTPARTHCIMERKSVESFYRSFPNVENGPTYPECDARGMYVTKRCQPGSSTICWCVRPETGEKILGTDFGGSNSAFELNCEQVGTLNERVTGFRTADVLTSIFLVQWQRIQNVNGYVLVLTNTGDDTTKTISVNANQNAYIFRMLQRGQRYNVGIFAVNSAGWSTPTTSIVVTTLIINKPANVRVIETTDHSATITWETDPQAEAYEVRLLYAKSNRVIRTFPRLLQNSFTISGLNSSVMYTVEVIALTTQISPNTDVPSDFVYYESPPTSVEFRLECRGPPLDLIYVYDSSYRHLTEVEDLFVDISSAAPPLKPDNGTRVAAVRYHTEARVVFRFNIFSRTSNLLRVLPLMINPSHGQNSASNVTKALSFIQDHFFTSPIRSTRRRENARSVVIFFSEGSSEDIEGIMRAANSLKSITNVSLLAIGVDENSNRRILSALASNENLKILLPSYKDLANAGAKVMEAICSL